MRAVFAYDHRFIRHGDLVLSENHFGAGFWDRYLAHFDRLTVLGRLDTMPPGKIADELLVASRPEVSFEFLPNLSSVRGMLLERPQLAPRLDALIAQHDAVVARLPSEIGLAALAAARRVNVPAAIEVVGCPRDSFAHHGSWLGRAYAGLAQRRMASAISAADHAVYVTERFLQRRYPAPAARCVVASNVELPPLDSAVLQRRLERIARPDRGALRLGLIGSLRLRTKGIQTVFAALSAARERLPRFEFRVLGGGNREPWIAEAARHGLAECTFFDGSLPGGEPVFEWLDQVDLYLQPSFQEGLPRALIEAMSRGCPAIASTIAGIPELLEREDLIGPGDAEALAGLLIARARDREWMTARARRNFEVAQRYEKHRLDARRDVFWAGFADVARSARRG